MVHNLWTELFLFPIQVKRDVGNIQNRCKWAALINSQQFEDLIGPLIIK